MICYVQAYGARNDKGDPLTLDTVTYGASLTKAVVAYIALQTGHLPSGPFSMLWDFMAASKLYTVFAGSVEVVGGMLLLVPELTTLGALVCTAAKTNVFVLNLAYDVPVKGRSLLLLLMSIFLLVPDLLRLTNVFILHRTPEPAPEEALSRNAMVCRAARWVPLILGLVMLCWIGVLIGECMPCIASRRYRRVCFAESGYSTR